MCTQSISRRPTSTQNISLFTFFFLYFVIATQDVFSATLCHSQSRSGPLLQPPCNHGGGAATAEWDPIIGALCAQHRVTWRAVREGRREWALKDASGSKETSPTSPLFSSDCSGRNGIHLNNFLRHTINRGMPLASAINLSIDFN